MNYLESVKALSDVVRKTAAFGDAGILHALPIDPPIEILGAPQLGGRSDMQERRI